MIHSQEYWARRQAWADAALADEALLDPARRCKGSYARTNQDGDVECCYVGLGYNLAPGCGFKPVTNGLTSMTPAIGEPGQVVMTYYGISRSILNQLVDRNDGGVPVEDINHFMLWSTVHRPRHDSLNA